MWWKPLLVTGTCTVALTVVRQKCPIFQVHVNWFLISCSCSGVGFTGLESLRHPGCEPAQVWEQQNEVPSYSSGMEKRGLLLQNMFSFAGASYPQNYIMFVLNFNCYYKTKLWNASANTLCFEVVKTSAFFPLMKEIGNCGNKWWKLSRYGWTGLLTTVKEFTLFFFFLFPVVLMRFEIFLE